MSTKNTPTPPTTSWWKSAGWSVLLLALFPVAAAVLWLIGRVSTSVSGWVGRLGITWSSIGWGALVVAGYGLVVIVVHSVRTVRARDAVYTQAEKELGK